MSLQAQSKTSVKVSNSIYGVVNVDSVLLSLPKVTTALSKIDSIQQQAQITAEPIFKSIRENQLLSELTDSSDTNSLKKIESDLQILYQELYLIEQKTDRALQPYQKDINDCVAQMYKTISDVGNQKNLLLVLPQHKGLLDFIQGTADIINTPKYISKDVLNLTQEIITKMMIESPATKPDKTGAKGATPNKKGTKKDTKNKRDSKNKKVKK